MRVLINQVKLPNGIVSMYRANETVYKCSPARVTCKISYSVVTQDYNNEPIEERCAFGISTKAAALKSFKALTNYHCGKVVL